MGAALFGLAAGRVDGGHRPGEIITFCRSIVSASWLCISRPFWAEGSVLPAGQGGERKSMSEDYARGRRDGLRLALALLEAEEAKWAALLGESSSWRTNATRQVRHKTLEIAQKRVRTALNRLTPKDDNTTIIELKSALDEVGL